MRKYVCVCERERERVCEREREGERERENERERIRESGAGEREYERSKEVGCWGRGKSFRLAIDSDSPRGGRGEGVRSEGRSYFQTHDQGVGEGEEKRVTLQPFLDML